MIIDSVAETSVWGGWSLDRTTALELAAFYRRTQPRVVVEAGSGYSTVVAGEYARDTGATVLSLDHDRAYADRTKGLLASHGLDRYVTVRHAPIADIPTPTGVPAPWYTTELPDGIDFALVDGPPGRIGRRGAMYGLMPHLNPDGWSVWLDDANRDGEQAALAEWQTHLGVSVQYVPLPRGLAVVTKHGMDRTTATQLVLTILTGNRPRLLMETLRDLDATAPGLLETAYIIVCHNGRDPATREVIESIPAVVEYRPVGGTDTAYPNGMVPIGEAMSVITHLVGHRFRGTGQPQDLWMHLEDDWRAATTTPASWWLQESSRVLREHPAVGQVRLRHRAEATHKRNIRTGKPIRWQPVDDHVLVSDTAHYTCNPAIMRVDDIGKVWPANGENGAIDRFAASGLRVAQLSPGVFHHIGGNQSLEGHPAPGSPSLRARRRPMARQAPGTPATPRSLNDYTRFYSAGGWTYNMGVEADVMRMIAYLAGWELGDRVHEIGAGRGDHAGIMAGLGYRVTAVELADTGTTATRERYPEVEAVNADVAGWTPTERGHVFARGMSWYHWELDGVNANGVDVPTETRGLVNRALDPDGAFVLQIWSDLSGRRYVNKVHDNSLADYHGLFDPIFTDVKIYDWSGHRIVPGIRHDRGVVVVARGLR